MADVKLITGGWSPVFWLTVRTLETLTQLGAGFVHKYFPDTLMPEAAIPTNLYLFHILKSISTFLTPYPSN